MPEIRLTRANNTGWPGASRRDLPPYNRYDHIGNGDTSNAAVGALGAWTGKLRDASTPTARNLTYQYVDTGFCTMHQVNVLWTDSASHCTIVALWRMGRAGMAHVVPSGLAARDTMELLNLYGAVPTDIYLATTPPHYDMADGFVTVKNTIVAHYGAGYAAIKTYLITGYADHDWAQEHQMGVDPKSGAYPVFN